MPLPASAKWTWHEPAVRLMCSQVDGLGCEVVKVTLSLIGRIDEAGINFLGSYGGGSGRNQE